MIVKTVKQVRCKWQLAIVDQAILEKMVVFVMLYWSIKTRKMESCILVLRTYTWKGWCITSF